MANLSRVDGTIDLFGPIKSVRAFLDLNDLMKNWYYNITMDINDELIKELETQIEEDPSQTHQLNINFSATGRWVFENNLENLMKSIYSERKTDTKFLNNWTVGCELAYLQLNKQPISISFEYYEIETGLEILNGSKYQIELVKDSFDQPNFYEIYHDVYDLTAENIHKLNPYEDAYDHSSYSVQFIDEDYENPNFEWALFIQEYVDDSIDTTGLDEDTERHQTFIKELGSQLDNLRLNKNLYNVLWTDIVHWFEDTEIQAIIKKLLK